MATTTAVATTATTPDDYSLDWNNDTVIAQSVFGGIGILCCLQVMVSCTRTHGRSMGHLTEAVLLVSTGHS
jgi:hypothetical protein